MMAKKNPTPANQAPATVLLKADKDYCSLYQPQRKFTG
jgi:hypothetical protein